MGSASRFLLLSDLSLSQLVYSLSLVLCLCYSRMENSALTGRQNIQTGAASEWSGGGGRGGARQHSLLFKVEDGICSEPHLEVDSDVQPNRVPIQESRQT